MTISGRGSIRLACNMVSHPRFTRQGNQWNFYDQPIVAYYSGFYRLPLGNPEPIENAVANNPGSFGYNEATRQFSLPPPSGQPELTLYASRATIDTGLENLGGSTIFAAPNNIFTISQQGVQQDITINEAAGFRLTKPLPEVGQYPFHPVGRAGFQKIFPE